MITELLKLPVSELLGLSVLGAVITTIGSLLALVLKEYLFTRSFELWKNQQALKQIYQKYRDPILLAAQELGRRAQQISDEYPPAFLRFQLLTQQPERMERNSAVDQYYQVYKLKSSVYRLCAFFGWLELYRREVVFLDSGKNHANQKLQTCLEAIRSDIADGQLNTAMDWDTWTDRLIFREEQRAIGEFMIVELAGKNSVMGFGKFCEFLNREPEEKKNPWLKQAIYFLTDLQPGDKDFRQVRFQRLVVHLYNLSETLRAGSLSDEQKAKRNKYRNLRGIM